MKRRDFLAGAASVVGSQLIPRSAVAADADKAAQSADLIDQLGITTGSFTQQLRAGTSQGRKFVMLDLPKIMRDELDLKVIDLMTATLPWRDPKYCERFRNEAEKCGRIITNLKLNFDGVDLAATDDSLRRKTMDEFKEGIDAAARLGCRWVRPVPNPKPPDLKLLAAGYRELIDYGAPKGIGLLVENNGWIKNDAEAIPRIVEAVGAGIAAQPDTGNWSPNVRYAGLEKAFPHAASCDFKALKLGPEGEHEDYDLKRCFEIGRRAGFRGPWCFEHFHEDFGQLLREFALLRDLVRKWMRE